MTCFGWMDCPKQCEVKLVKKISPLSARHVECLQEEYAGAVTMLDASWKQPFTNRIGPTWAPTTTFTAVRYASNFSLRRTKYRKAHKGKIPLPTGGSTKGTTVVFGDYGLRIKEAAPIDRTPADGRPQHTASQDQDR